MNIDFETFFQKYEALLAIADDVFERMKKDYPESVKCKIRCADCCHALFDLSLIEAMYINHHFNKKFQGKARKDFIEKTNKIDRKIYKIKQKAYREFAAGKAEGEILEEMASKRVRCPLLNDQEQCDLYEYRPITCRFYGLPTSIGGVGHTCGLSGFVEGRAYPTVDLDIIQKKLFELSHAFVKEIKSRHFKMADILVPISMAILTDYDEAYLGIEDKEKADSGADAENTGDTDG
jgi:Fe-S-cluster containining protein